MKEVRIQTLGQIEMVDKYELDGIHREIPQELGNRLIDIARTTTDLEDGIFPSNESLIEIAQSVSRQYGFFMEDADDARLYLCARPHSAYNGRIRPNIGSARLDFYNRITTEFEALDLSEQDREDIDSQVVTAYYRMNTWLTSELEDRTRVFWETTASLRDPDPALLREELSVRAVAALRNLVDQIAAYGKRPPAETILHKSLGAVAAHVPQVAAKVYNQSMYDAQIEALLDAHQLPDQHKIIARGIRSAYVQAAKESFGQEVPVLDKGANSDPKELLDPYERPGEGELLTRARLPTEFVKAALGEWTEQLLYNDISPVSQRLNMFGSAIQRSARTDRKQFAMQAGEHDPNYIVRMDELPISPRPISPTPPYKPAPAGPRDVVTLTVLPPHETHKILRDELSERILGNLQGIPRPKKRWLT